MARTIRPEELPPPTPIARAHARALARMTLELYRRGDDPEAFESFRRAVMRIWKLKYKYYKDDDLFQELVKKGIIPPEP